MYYLFTSDGKNVGACSYIPCPVDCEKAGYTVVKLEKDYGPNKIELRNGKVVEL